MCPSDLCVSHAGGCYQGLLEGLVLQTAVLLLALRAPFQLQQVLDDLWVASESSVDQRTLATLVHVVNLSKLTTALALLHSNGKDPPRNSCHLNHC